MNSKKLLKSWACIAAGCAIAGALHAEPLKRSFCVWDPVGANGPMYSLMKSSKPAAMKWGVDLELKPYTDEKIAAEDFKAGQCDSVLLTGTRAREFNKFTGSLEALGAIPSDDDMRTVLATLSQAKASKYLQNGNYEVAGIVPAGAVYLFMRDRAVDSVEELQGKKIATFDYDNAAMHMVRHVGASVVGSSSSSFAGKFNNGSVDVAYAPAVAYTPLELYKGLADHGGVIDFKLAQMTFQVIIQRDKFPADYAQNVRDFVSSKYDEAYELVASAESDIKADQWVKLAAANVEDYMKMFREVRIGLREDGVYDSSALKMFRIIRCKKNPTHAECVEQTE
ncbi:MAG: hypothetical protein H6999_06075 [Hahellaceae bacterium]|nr:hypothetical protein [Hahellaceae bacterium]MCP5169308.1 hypothetical protein [Hahellaceae bacterium]